MILVKDLVKKFVDSKREFLVLDKINFEVRKNKFVAIVGPVGCGKTTLLNIIGGLESPTSGEVLINGEKVNSPREDVAMIFQDSLLFPWKTVSENVELPIKYKFNSKKERKLLIEKYLRKTGMIEFANFYPKQLSGGMKQKVSFAKILVSSPKILLLDEPFSMLDAQTRILMQEELLKIWEQIKGTILLVTHNLEEAIFLSDRIILLSSLPTRVLKEIEIDLPKPRNQEIKSTKKFNELRDEIWKLLKTQINNF